MKSEILSGNYAGVSKVVEERNTALENKVNPKGEYWTVAEINI